MTSHKEQAEQLILKVQEKKKPLDEKRSALHAQLKELLASIAEKEQALRGKIKLINADVAKLDELMSSINAAKHMKGEMASKVLSDLNAAAEEI